MPITIERKTMRKDSGWAAWNGNVGVFIAWAEGESHSRKFKTLNIMNIYRPKEENRVRAQMRGLSPKEFKIHRSVEMIGIPIPLVPAAIQIINMLAQENLRGPAVELPAQPVGQKPIIAAVPVEMDEVDKLLSKFGMFQKKP
jgi:hypothetical protein